MARKKRDSANPMDLTVRELAHKTAGAGDGNQILFTDPNADLSKAAGLLHAKEKEQTTEQIKLREITEKAYNDNITNLDPQYANLHPLGGHFIVRYFILPSYTSASEALDLVANNRRKVQTYTANDHKDRMIEDPFNFDMVAIIVASPETEKFILPGQIYNVTLPRTLTSLRTVVGFENAYIHPGARLERVPDNPANPHFGYALIPRSNIRVAMKPEHMQYVNEVKENKD